MYDIPMIVEDLYYSMVVIPDREDWPEYLGNSELVVNRLYAFYSGLRIGSKLSEALRKEVIPFEE